jgi:plastocyanin
MVINNLQQRKADVVRRHTFETSREKDVVASARWMIDPGVIHASPGDTVKWTVHDSNHRDVYLRDVDQVFEPGSFSQEGNTCRATISAKAERCHYYEYRFFWGSDEAHGGSAPGVIIE